jgi:hypothetical protein
MWGVLQRRLILAAAAAATSCATHAAELTVVNASDTPLQPFFCLAMRRAAMGAGSVD